MREAQQAAPQPQGITECKREGTFSAGIKDIKMIQHRFDESEIECKIEFITQELEVGKIYLDFSQNYIQKGPDTGQRSCDVSVKTLEGLGVSKNEFANLRKLVGTNINVYGKLNDKGYLNYYISSYADVEIDANAAVAKLQALFGPVPTTAAAPAPTPTPVQQAQPVQAVPAQAQPVQQAAQQNMFAPQQAAPAQQGGATTPNASPFGQQ